MKRHEERHKLGLSSIQGGVEAADALLILFQRTGIPLLPMRAQSTDLRTMCVSLHIYCMHVWVKWIHCSSFYFPVCNHLNQSSWPEKCSQMILIRLIKMWINVFNLSLLTCSLSLPFRLISAAHSLYLASSFSPLCFSSAFLFSADIMTPHSATALMESRCRLEVTLSRPTCLAAL